MMIPGDPRRGPPPSLFVAAVAGALLVSSPVHGQDRAPVYPTMDSVRVSGVVTDRATGRELSGVELRLESVDVPTPVEWAARTPASGRFRSPLLPAGSYRIRVTALGFSTMEEDLTLMGASEVELRIELVPDALELDPILITSFRRTRFETSGFEQRRRLGFGHTFTRDEIERRAPFQVSDLLRSVPGAEITTVRGRAGSEVRLRRGCVPDVVINGIMIRNPGPIDDLLSVGDLEALEVHHGGAGSLTLSGNNCGAIMAWTREGGGEEVGDIPRFDKLVVALSIMTMGFLLAR
jgi:hypothetical protein